MRITLLIVFLLSIWFTSCGDSIEGGLNKQIAVTDSIKIYFFDEKTGATKNVVTISDQNEINTITASITDETAESFKCGYSGQLEFYKADSIIFTPEFNYMEECPHYVFMFKKNLYRKVMSKEGREFLNSKVQK
jgi:hypothetical protein